MGRKPRAPKPQYEGTWPIESGTCRIQAHPGRDGAYVIFLDHVASSTIVVGAPRVLIFDYMEWIAHIIRLRNFSGAHFLHLGGAAATLPRYFVDVWPDSHHTVVELDGMLVDVIRNTFGLPEGIDYVLADARTATHSMHEGEADVIIRDAFANGHVPRHLMTVEFFEAARRALAPGGLYVANIGDKEDLANLRAEVAGMQEVFPHIGVIGPAEMLAGRAFGNVVLVASMTELPASPMLRSVAHLAGTALRDQPR